MNKTEYKFFKVLFFLSFFVFGLFYEHMACIFGGIFGLFYVYLSVKKKHMSFYVNLESIGIILITLMYLITCIYGVDAGMGYMGFSKNIAILFFLCCTMQLEEQQREEMRKGIPVLGSVMTVIGLISYGIKPLYQFLFTADRLGGFFQYANVFALFCLIGIFLLADKKEEGIKWKLQIVQVIFLILGILLSGSRSIFFLMIGACIVLIVRKKEFRKSLLLIMVLVLIGAGVFVGISGNVQNVGRFLTVSLQSSTFLGRILYFKDGVKLLLKQPFGFGYLGYYFMEPSIQTGIYSVRYVHNDFLQMALDMGVLPAVFFIFLLVKNIFEKGKELRKRLLFLVMTIHFLMDFDLEFTSIWLLLILIMDIYQGKVINIAAGGKTAFYKILAGIVTVGNIYIGIAMIPRYVGYGDISVKLIPFYTEAKVEVLAKETDSAVAVQMAEELLEQNKYIAEAYDILAVTAYQSENYEKMAEYKKKSVELQKYNMEVYERYVIMLSQGISESSEQGDEEMAFYLMKKVAEVPEIIGKVEQETDSLAYQIRDLPDFEMKDEVTNYIEQVEEIVRSYEE